VRLEAISRGRTGNLPARREVIGEFVPTTKNGRVADFYPTRGFVSAEKGRFRLALADAPLAFPPHFKSVVVDGERVIS